MCLSDCALCKYFNHTPHHSSDIVCGLNPSYAVMWKRLESLDEYIINYLPIDDCPEFKLDPNYKKKEIMLSLPFIAWQTLVRESNNPGILDALRDAEIQLNLSLTFKQWQAIANFSSNPHVRVSLQAEGIEPQHDPWTIVDSSCIDAISYNEEALALKIRFNSGQVHQYERVPNSIVLSFLDADSKDCYFERYIKDAFSYRLL